MLGMDMSDDEASSDDSESSVEAASLPQAENDSEINREIDIPMDLLSDSEAPENSDFFGSLDEQEHEQFDDEPQFQIIADDISWDLDNDMPDLEDGSDIEDENEDKDEDENQYIW